MVHVDCALVDAPRALKVALRLLEGGVLEPRADGVAAHPQPVFEVLALFQSVDGELLRVGDLLRRRRVVVVLLPLARLAEDLLGGDLHRRWGLILRCARHLHGRAFSSRRGGCASSCFRRRSMRRGRARSRRRRREEEDDDAACPPFFFPAQEATIHGMNEDTDR